MTRKSLKLVTPPSSACAGRSPIGGGGDTSVSTPFARLCCRSMPFPSLSGEHRRFFPLPPSGAQPRHFAAAKAIAASGKCRAQARRRAFVAGLLHDTASGACGELCRSVWRSE